MFQTTFPEFTIHIDNCLNFKIKVYECYIPRDHFVYQSNTRSMRNITVSSLVNVVQSLKICIGIEYIKDVSAVYFHVIPLRNDDEDEEQPLTPFKNKKYVRDKNCMILLEESDKCVPCMKSEKLFFRNDNKKRSELDVPAKLKAPLSVTHKIKVCSESKSARMQTNESQIGAHEIRNRKKWC